MTKGLDHEQDILAKIPRQLPGSISGGLLAVVAIGTAAFVYGVTAGDGHRAWQIFLVNFLFWSGIAQAGVVFAAILRVVNGRWAKSVQRLSESTGAFLPVSMVLFLALYLGRNAIFPWIGHPLPEKAIWLNAQFLFTRDGLSLLALYGLSLVFLYFSVRPDAGLAVESGARKGTGLYGFLYGGWRGLELERHRSRRTLAVLSPVILLLYAYVFSLIAFDLVMSLSPHWYSNLFGGYFFMSNMYAGLAAVIILTALARKHLELERYVTPSQFHDLGKLLFGFCVFWGYLTFTQFIVIWYGNMPEETEFLILRAKEAPWAALSKSIALAGFAIPFVLLLSREVKRRPARLAMIAGLALLAMWFERFVLVAPSLSHGAELPFGVSEILISLGFLALFAMTCLSFLSYFPAVSLSGLAQSEEHETAQQPALEVAK